ncbi:MAG TPA: hypothetical protein VHE37_03720, partial [Nevskiaceae bacterium]|nr:hypothetical protein [Nevskiaceae bacterium]
FSFRLAVDQGNPAIVYAATSKGLFRSADAGASYVNVALPVSSDCAGVEALGPCQFANFVTDVVVKQPGGSTSVACDPKGCPVLAAVGFRSGMLPYPDTATKQSPGNGVYRSDTGEAGTFAMVGNYQITGVEPVGFTLKSRIGRVALGNAIGDAQNHDYVYAMVQDAGYLNGDIALLDFDADIKDPTLPTGPVCSALALADPTLVDTCTQLASKVPSPTTFNGLFVSTDFGDTWLRMADDKEITYNETTSSSIAPVIAIGEGPGIQAWYNLWVRPDPTQQLAGAPTRVLFGLEEIWKNRLNVPQDGLAQAGPDDYHVIGTYFAGQTCLFLIGNAGLPSLPVCPTYPGLVHGTTTHPDQHDGIFIPDTKNGGVWLHVGSDGGSYKQYSSDPTTDDFANNKWSNGTNNDRYTLMVYGIAVAKDGTVYYGLQDNASGKIEPDTHRSVRIYIGDGMWTAVDPDNSMNAYYSTPGLAVVATTDGGATDTDVYPPNAVRGTPHFLSPFVLDPTDANHIVMA